MKSEQEVNAKSSVSEADESTQDKIDDLKSFIFDRWQVFQQSLDQYQWSWETARWHELIFCLMTRLGEPDLNVGTARTLVILLAGLDLLRVDFLAKLISERKELDTADPDSAFLLQLLERSGLSAERAKSVLTAICQTALGLQTHYNGKIQLYLRHYGNQMLDELGDTFRYSDISGESTRHAFTHWLQNVLNMPLALSEPAVTKFIMERGTSLEELVRVADDLDLNLALLDDMIVTFESEAIKTT